MTIKLGIDHQLIITGEQQPIEDRKSTIQFRIFNKSSLSVRVELRMRRNSNQRQSMLLFFLLLIVGSVRRINCHSLSSGQLLLKRRLSKKGSQLYSMEYPFAKNPKILAQATPSPTISILPTSSPQPTSEHYGSIMYKNKKKGLLKSESKKGKRDPHSSESYYGKGGNSAKKSKKNCQNSGGKKIARDEGKGKGLSSKKGKKGYSDDYYGCQTHPPTKNMPLVPTVSPEQSPQRYPSPSPTLPISPSVPIISARPQSSTAPPTATKPTPVPTSETNKLLTPFNALYSLASAAQPDEISFAAAENITLAYLNDFLKLTYEFVPGTTMEQFSGKATGNSSDPVAISYEGMAVFTEDSILVPSQLELDLLVEDAFQQPKVEALVMTLQNLPAENPFSTTTNVDYKKDEIPSATMSSIALTKFRFRKNSAGGISIATSTAGFLVIFGALSFVFRLKKRGVMLGCNSQPKITDETETLFTTTSM